MNAVVDRIVQYANRYKLTDVSTGNVLGTFDFDEVTGTVQQVGTEIDKELFDSIADDLATRLVANGGDSKDVIVTFTEATTIENITSKEKHSTILGKIAKWFTDCISKLKKFAYDSATKVTASDVDATIPSTDALENGDITVMNAEYANSASRATADKNGKDITTYVATETDPTVPSWAKNATKPAYTKAEVGLGNVDNTSDTNKPVSTAQQTALDKKVDKVSGKGLSTNDYTTNEKNKLAGLPTDSVRYGEQTLTEAQKSQARSNIGAGTSDFDGTWGSLSGKPSVVQATGQSTRDVMSQKAVTDALSVIKTDKHGQTQLTNQDLNDLQGEDTVGWYFAAGSNTCANKPTGVDAFGLEVGRSATGYYFQVLTSANTTGNRRFVRTYSSSWGSWAKLAITEDIPTKLSQLTNDSDYATTSAVNAKYTKPSGGIPKTDLASDVQTSLSKADTALQSAPVTSVNGKTGAVTLGAGDVSALPASTKFVSSVNGQTGAVTGLATTEQVKAKQNTLTDAQLAAANSGITEAKVTKYDGYESTINGKQAAITTSNKLSASLVSGLATVATSGSYNDLSNKPTIPSNVVQYTAQTLTDAQKTQARTNIGAGTSSFSGSYNDLTNKPTIPDVSGKANLSGGNNFSGQQDINGVVNITNQYTSGGFTYNGKDVATTDKLPSFTLVGNTLYITV